MRHQNNILHCIVTTLLALGFLLVGSPLLGQAPAGYYDTVNDSNPSALRTTLHDVIDDHTWFPYTASTTDTWDIVNIADEDPANPGNIVDVYKNVSYPKIPGGVGDYNREHSWPKSYGFPNLVDFNYPYTDCHHLFASDGGYNSSRSNKPFRFCDGSCSENTTALTNGRGGGSGIYPGNSNWTTGSFTQGTWETWDGRKGDVARAIFYMDLRYEGGNHGLTGHFEPDLIVTDTESLIDASNTGSNETIAYMGMLSVLLQWHAQDPPDDVERARNDAVFSFQGNRNPFIDRPDWVECLYNNLCAGSGDTTPPAAPAGLFAASGEGFVDLTWNANSENDLQGYYVYRATSSGGPYTRITGSILTATSYADTGVVGGTTYFYVVRALDTSFNESTSSNEVMATPTAPPPPPPPPPGSGPGVILSEVVYDVSSTDDGWEWVELYNSTGTVVDVTGWCLANGGTSYSYSQVTLSGTIAPGATFVVGGPSSGATNGNPSFDQVVNFGPDFQNSGTTADGVALFDVPCSQVLSAVPLDAVIYGSTNSSGLIDETGAANAPEIGDVSSGRSIERVDLAGNWQSQASPTPNTTPLPPPVSNTAPTVTITSPADGSSFEEGTSVSFSGTAPDTEDGDLSANLSWTSDLDGAIGSGASFATSTLSLGTHTITADVTDSGALSGSDAITVTITATPPPPPPPPPPGGTDVILSEVLYDIAGTDDGLEWVELYNQGASDVDLTGWCLANGGTSWAASQVTLSGTIPAGGTFVVGGPTTNATNFNPVFDQAVSFNPDFQNSGTTGDGVALFNVACSQVLSSVPVDAVIYGPNNNNGLIDETGTANPPEVGDAASSWSLERVDLAGLWQTQSAPNPNTTPFGTPPPPPPPPPPAGPPMEWGAVTVDGATATVVLTNTYVSPVVVTTIEYSSNTTPVVTRVSNVTATSFDLRIQNPSGGPVAADTVSYIVVEEGAHTIDGVKLEAQKFTSTVTDENNSWGGEAQSYLQSYTNPVVLGQVMSENDLAWSVFWNRGSNRTSPPSASTLFTGKTVAEDPFVTRAAETVGFIVIEAGHGTLGGVELEAALGADTVRGPDDSPPYTYTFNTGFASAPAVGLATMAGMDGNNGGWAYTTGFTASTFNLLVDEDQLGDAERRHTTEQVGYLVFATAGSTN